MALSIENSQFCFVNNFQYVVLMVNICKSSNGRSVIFLQHRTFQ